VHIYNDNIIYVFLHDITMEMHIITITIALIIFILTNSLSEDDYDEKEEGEEVIGLSYGSIAH